MAKHDTAGLTVSGAKWLVEEKGALAVGTDTSGVEVLPPKEQLDDGTSFNPVHVYLLVRQASTSSSTRTRRGWRKTRSTSSPTCSGSTR
jgi:hypothetical protein